MNPTLANPILKVNYQSLVLMAQVNSRANGAELLFAESQETRILRLESSVEKLLSQTSATDVKIDNLTEKIEEGFQSVNKRFDQIQERLDDGSDQFRAHQKLLDTHDDQLARIREQAIRSAHTKKKIKRYAVRILLGILLAAGGVLGGYFGHAILSLFGI